MLQPRNLVRLRQCISYFETLPSLINTPHFSTFRCLRQENKPQSPIFVPKAPSKGRTAFSIESPTKHAGVKDIEGMPLPEAPQVSIDNYFKFETRRLPQTGKLSGRTVSCPMGRMNMAFATLNRIIRDNKIKEEWASRRERLKPSEALRKLRSKRHRIRFKQGVARLANIVLRMRKKNY